MPDNKLNQQQKASQSQVMSSQQIMAIKMLGMSSQELRDEILAKIDENPALELVKDPFSDGVDVSVKNSNLASGARVGKSSSKGQLESDNFQLMLESSPDNRETLQDHLIHQLNMSNLSSSENVLCKKLIENLDENGFYVLAPISLLDSKEDSQSKSFLNHCISIVRHFDPPGICVQNLSESLKVQFDLKMNSDSQNISLAKKNEISKLVYFFLDSHLDFLNPPIAEKVCKKVQGWLLQQKTLSFQSEKQKDFLPDFKTVTEKNVQKAISIIQSLNPYPAAEFNSSSSQHFISPDVYVVRCSGAIDSDDFSIGLVKNDSNSFFRVVISKDSVPVVRLSKDFNEEKLDEKNQSKKEQQFIKTQLKNAEFFLGALDFRYQAIIESCSNLVHAQKLFFSKGYGNLVPLSQRQFAKELGVHESTVSRLANSKFIQCDWGTFPLKYFFSSAIKKDKVEDDAGESNSVSSDTVRIEIENILKNNSEGKKLSDQKIADLLAEKGYKIARRTFSKYRSQLMIGSSYERV